MGVFPGLILALALAIGSQYISEFIGISLMGLPKSPISGIMMAILIGILIRNTVGLSAIFQAGIRFGLVRVLRAGIVLLGIRLSLGEIGTIGLQSLPVIVACIITALLIVTYVGRKLGLSNRLGTLIAVGTSICGATAIIATAPAIAARDTEVTYSVACITVFGALAMLVYPFAAHWMFAGDAFASGLFIGTAVHDTSQVAGAGLVYQQYYDDPRVLDIATVTKLVRNLGMLIVIPLMSIAYNRNSTDREAVQKWWTMIPLFVVGFACMSLLRTIGDMGTPVFGFIDVEQWHSAIVYTKKTAEICLAVAMASVGLGTCLRDIQTIGIKPLAVGLFSALLVGGVSVSLISILY